MYLLPLCQIIDSYLPWEEWDDPTSTNTINFIISSFLQDLLHPHIPNFNLLIGQELGLSANGLGLLCLSTHTEPNFVLSMTSAF
jgi:hypothetical protein